MKKALLISGVLLALAASTAMAGGVNLSWNDCGLNGAADQTFLCNTNGGAEHKMVVSYDLPADIGDVAATDFRVDLQSADATNLNAWWQIFNSGSCRSSQPTVDVAGFSGACYNFWGDHTAGGGGGASYTINGNKASLLGTWATPDPGPVTAGTETYSVNIRLTNSKTVGSPSCAGCLTPVCLVLNVVAISYGPSAASYLKIENPRDRNWITWQGGAGVTGGCPGATPTRTETWGKVKALYR